MPQFNLVSQVRALTEIQASHAHVYFNNDAERSHAAWLHRRIHERFHVELDELRDCPHGPHVTLYFHAGFETGSFASFVPWLMLNAVPLKILIHPNTDSPFEDHVSNSLWMRGMQDVPAAGLPRPLKALGRALERVEPNTKPSLELE